MDELSSLFDIGKVSELALSYSRLSDFDRNGVKALTKPYREDLTGDGIKIGSLVDDLLLNQKNFKKLYYIFDGTKPTATLGKLCDIIVKNYKKIPSINTILKIAQDNSFWIKWSPEKVKETIDIPDFWNYLKAEFISNKKMVITTDELNLAKNLVKVLRDHEYSRHIFKNDLEHFNQFKFNIEYNGFILRGIIDKLVIDHKAKTVQIIDLKTGKGLVAEFLSSLLKWRYYLQSAVYTNAFEKICEVLKLKGYVLLPFSFLYISRFEQIPLVFTMTQKWHDASIHGFTTNSGYRYRGLNELLDEVRWHIKNNVFDTTRLIYESKGIIQLDDSFINLNK